MKILVRGTNWVGDAVMSVPALRELRRIFPESWITLHMRSWADGLFRDAEFIDDLVTFDKHRWAAKDVYDNSQFLRIDKYDLAVLLPNSFESALTSFLTRIPRRFGYNKDLRGLLLTDPIAVPEWKGRKHEVLYYLNLIAEVERRVLGRDTVSRAVPNSALDLPVDRKLEARQWLLNAGVNTAKKIVAFGVGSANSIAKRWPADRFAELADRLQTEEGVRIVLLGSKNETGVARKVERLCPSGLTNLTGETDLAEAVGILSVVDLVISNDMGLAHIAPAVGTPTIVIFGPTNSETTRPLSDNAQILQKTVSCPACVRGNRDSAHVCMTGVTVDQVFQAARVKLTAEEDKYEETAGSLS